MVSEGYNRVRGGSPIGQRAQHASLFPANDACRANRNPDTAMNRLMPPISTEQVRAFVELVRTGSIRLAAQSLHLSEEGLRSRLLTLEERLGVALYEKERGRRGEVRLTHAGRVFTGKAEQFLEEAHALTHLFEPGQQSREIQIAASQYITYYVLIDVMREFHAQSPEITLRLFTRTEQQILADLQSDTSLALGACAPIEYPVGLIYHPWFVLPWYFVAAIGHPLLERETLSIEELVDEPLIVFEAGSTGRQHVLEAFYKRGLTPRIAMETTSTQVVVRMVEAGLGTAIVPLLPSGIVTRGLRVGQVELGQQIRPMESGIFSRPDWSDDFAVRTFIEFARARASVM
jgi:DNA-binding transcriptional LysR family regulator